MKILYTSQKTFELTDGSVRLGQINYAGLFSYTAFAIAGNDRYEITPMGFFDTTISVTKNGTGVASIKNELKKSYHDFIFKRAAI